MSSLILKEECYRIQGAIFEVYREIGCGFLESVYQECLFREFSRQKISFLSQPTIEIAYKGEMLKQIFKPDFVCFDQIIVELKAVKAFAPEHEAQLINYLKITKKPVGLLVNFGTSPKTQIKRFVL
jgi:GxxExxY protein